jgi:ABC-type branched-subunit amino acid transport system substrate-binding protein
VSRYYKVPQISYGSTSSEFTEFHASRYPYFLRTTPNLNLESELLAHLIASHGWKQIALIYTTDTQMFHSVQLFTASAQKLDITIRASASFATGTTNISTQMRTIKQSQARIILFIGTIIDQQVVINNSLIEGLTGPGYQWIGIHASMYRQLCLNSTGGTIKSCYEWSQGFIGLQNLADVNSNVYKEYAQRWATTPHDPEASTVDHNSISPIANFAYDACFMFAHALHHMIEVLQLDPMEMNNREIFLATLKNVNFLGVSGYVSVDENGDRLAPFDIVNFQHEQIVKVGSITIDGQVSYLPQMRIMYTGGTETKPLDMPIRPLIKISLSTLIGIIGGSITCTIFCLILIFFTCYFKQHPVIKASSSMFLVLMVIGTISLAVSVIPRTLESYRQSHVLCISELWLANIGYTLIIGTLLVSSSELILYRTEIIRLFYEKAHAQTDRF